MKNYILLSKGESGLDVERLNSYAREGWAVHSVQWEEDGGLKSALLEKEQTAPRGGQTLSVVPLITAPKMSRPAAAS